LSLKRLKPSALSLRRPCLLRLLLIRIVGILISRLIGRWIVCAHSVSPVILIISVVPLVLSPADSQVPLEQPQVFGLEHPVRLESDVHSDYGEDEEYDEHGGLEPVALVAPVVALRELTELNQVADCAEVRDAVVDHDDYVEYHEAKVHRLRSAQENHRIEELIDAWEANRTDQRDHHNEVSGSEQVKVALHFAGDGRGECLLLTLVGIAPIIKGIRHMVVVVFMLFFQRDRQSVPFWII